MDISVSFNGGPCQVFERELTKLLGESHSSGCCLFGEMTRDLQYDYKWKSKKEYAAVMVKAKAAAKRLKITGFEMDDHS